MRSIGRAAALLCLLAAVPAVAQEAAPRLDVLARLPQDPLLVWAFETESLAATLDQTLAQIERFAPEDEDLDLAGSLAEIDARLGVSLRNDLLARLGPEMAVVVDLPPLDTLMGLAMGPTPEMMDHAFGSTGLLIQVREPAKLEAALKTMFTKLGAAPVPAGDGFKVVVPKTAVELQEAEGAEEAAPAPPPAFYWQIRDGWLAAGAAPSWLGAAARPPAAGAGLTAGRDFQHVVRHLDAGSPTLAYVNLPKLGALLRGSALVQNAIAGQPESQEIVQWLLDEQLTSGWGRTAIEVDGGVRTTSFGPEILSGLFSSGMMAALVVPNLLEALDKAKVKRTTADLATIDAALASHQAEHGGYPASDGWVELSTVAGLGGVPATDGWEQSLQYWSDGERYVVVSPGKDGMLDRDWSQPAPEEGEEGMAEGDDVVYADGMLVSSPGEA